MRLTTWFLSLLCCIALHVGSGSCELTPDVSAQQLLDQTPSFPFQHVLGGGDTPSCTIVSYTSLSCETCATFHEDMKALSKAYPDVRFVSRDFPTDGPALMASLVCWWKEVSSAPLRQALYHAQQDWVDQPNHEALKKALIRVVQQVNPPDFPEEEIKHCLGDKSHLMRMMKFKQQEKKLANLVSVPLAFVICHGDEPGTYSAISRVEYPDKTSLEKAIKACSKPAQG